MESVQHRLREERRREPRFVADLETVMIWEGTHEPVNIQNISAYGALLVGRCFPQINTRVTLVGDGFEISATVIWVGADRCGVLLSGPVAPLEIIRDRPVRTVARTDGMTITLQRTGPYSYA